MLTNKEFQYLSKFGLLRREFTNNVLNEPYPNKTPSTCYARARRWVNFARWFNEPLCDKIERVGSDSSQFVCITPVFRFDHGKGHGVVIGYRYNSHYSSMSKANKIISEFNATNKVDQDIGMRSTALSKCGTYVMRNLENLRSRTGNGQRKNRPWDLTFSDRINDLTYNIVHANEHYSDIDALREYVRISHKIRSYDT